MILKMGSNSVLIQESRIWPAILKSKWHDYILTQKQDPLKSCAELLFEDGLQKDAVHLHEGWNTNSSCEKRQVTYVSQSRQLFSLKYDYPANQVTVRLPEENVIYTQLGAMYGMLLALHKNCIGLHGVTLKCASETIILSAPSGTGKTTLAELLVRNCGAKIINGDFALLSVCDDGVFFEPTPFCGTSGICHNQRTKVNRIVFLEQAADNNWKSLDGREALLRMLSNSFVPVWDDDIRDAVYENAVSILSRVRTSLYSFAPTWKAARFFQLCLFDDRHYESISLRRNSYNNKEVNNMEYNFKFPTSQEEMDELKKSLRSEISEDDLVGVVGGNDDPTMQNKQDPPTPWVCPGCGATIMIRQFQDGPKHMTKCPGNPFK